MFLGPITHAEQLAWQRRALSVLDGYLDVATLGDLPPIRWTVTTAGSTLIGHCRSRSEWDAWQGLLHLPDVRPETVHDGHTRRRATGLVAAPSGLTTHVTLIADIDLDHEQLNHEQLNHSRDDDPPQDVA